MFNPSQYIRGCYQLPGDPARDVFMIPVSGGADSTALAIMMVHLFPSVEFKFVFTDTNADEVEIYETLDNLEQFLGITIHRIKPELGLYEMIEKFNGFLPSSRDRWCTKELKLKPFEQYLGQIKPIFGGKIWSFVGIRHDEPFRSGLVSQDDDVMTELPFKAWKVERADVFAILTETIGVPRYYQRRTRSGCYSCWGMRKSEAVGLLEARPVQFFKAASYEKLSPRDEAKKREVLSVPAELGIGHNWVGFPIPRELDLRCKETQAAVFDGWTFFDLRPMRQPASSRVVPFPKRWEGEQKTDWKGAIKAAMKAADGDDAPQMSFMGEIDPMNRIWVGVEFRIDPGIGGDGVFWQQIVTFSTTRGGLSKQLQGHFEHRLKTAEAIGLSQDEVRDHVKYAVYCIEAPRALMDTSKPSEGTFSWKHGETYDMVARLTRFAKRTLNVARIEQDARIAEAEGKPGRAEKLRSERALIRGAVGTVLGMGSFLPKERETEEEMDEQYIPCFACSI